MKRKALGKGLAALLPKEPAEQAGESLLQVELQRIDPNPEQPRQSVDEQKLAELAQSLKEQGVVQPLVVRKEGSRFQIIAGERRWRAAKLAGLVRIPVIVREADDNLVLELALVENIQREELNPMEEAVAYRRLVSEFGYSQEQVATRVGKDRSTVANLLRLLRLPTEVRSFIAESRLSPGHARPLLALSSLEKQVEIAKLVVERKLSVREVERMVNVTNSESLEGVKKIRTDPNTRDAERRLQEVLGTRVRIKRKGKSRGHVEIGFHSEEELQHIYETIHFGVGYKKDGLTTPKD